MNSPSDAPKPADYSSSSPSASGSPAINSSRSAPACACRPPLTLSISLALSVCSTISIRRRVVEHHVRRMFLRRQSAPHAACAVGEQLAVMVAAVGFASRGFRAVALNGQFQFGFTAQYRTASISCNAECWAMFCVAKPRWISWRMILTGARGSALYPDAINPRLSWPIRLFARAALPPRSPYQSVD